MFRTALTEDEPDPLLPLNRLITAISVMQGKDDAKPCQKKGGVDRFPGLICFHM